MTTDAEEVEELAEKYVREKWKPKTYTKKDKEFSDNQSDFWACPNCDRCTFLSPYISQAEGDTRCRCGFKGKLKRLSLLDVQNRLNDER